MSDHTYIPYDDWLREWGTSESTIRQRTKFLGRVEREWGTAAPPTPVVVEWLAQYHGWTRRTYAGHLTSIHRWMIETGQLSDLPLSRYRRPGEPRPKPKPLTAQELDAAMGAASDRLRTWLLLGCLAGLRAHEIAKFHGRDIDERMIFVRGKGGDESLLPAHPALWTLAQDYPRDGYWFASPHPQREHVCASLVSNEIRALFRSVGIEHGAAHRLRYTYGTRLADAGTPIRVVQELLRHRSLETTMRYVGVEDAQMRAAIERLAA